MNKLKVALRRDAFVLSTLVGKDFKRKYRRSVLGVAWSVLNPFLMMVVLTAVFSMMFRFSIEHFPLYLILGQILFNFMQSSTTTGMTSIIDAAPLIKKIRVNKTLFPVQKVVFELLNFAISLVAVAAVMLYYQIAPTVNLLLLPLLLVYVFFFCTGLSLLLSSLAVFFRDFVHLWSVFVLAWTYLTPLFYPVEMLESWMYKIMMFNPMYHFVTYFRQIALWHQTPDLRMNLICLGCALVTFLVGLLTFRKLQKKFILYV